VRVAITAYACKSESGSEPGAGFEWAAAASEHSEVTLFTRPLDIATRSRLATLGIRVHELPIGHNSRTPQLSYIRWLLQANRLLRGEHARGAFDVTHHVTYATDWLPCPNIPGVPLVLGPVGGRTTTPRALKKLYPASLLVRDALRTLLTTLPRAYTKAWAKGRVNILLAQNSDTAKVFDSLADVRVRTNCVVDPPELNVRRTRDEKTAVFAGRLIPLKGVHLAIQALTMPSLQDWKLVILGDGPERFRLEALADRLGVGERTIFKGTVPRSDAIQIVSTATCSVLLSAHDAAGWSAAESIAVGTPVVTWDHGGPAELLRAAGVGVSISTAAPTLPLIAEAIARAEPPVVASISQFSRRYLQGQTANWYRDAVKESIV
jgi:glycosyltransferase involved in cell wall biosynthesis